MTTTLRPSAASRRRGAKRIARRLALGTIAAVSAATMSGCSLLFPFNLLDGAGDGGEQSTGGAADALTWEACPGSEEGLLCSSFEAPVDWAEPDGEQTEMLLIKLEAAGDKLGTLFYNPGGPGYSGVDDYFSSNPGATGIALKDHYDIVAWDTRGVVGSTEETTGISCVDDAGMDDYLFGVSQATASPRGSAEWIAATAAEATAFGKSCAENSGPLLGHVDAQSTVQDLELLRTLVGDDQLNYLGEGYGGYIGALYADAYPDKVGRMVLDGAIDPTLSMSEINLGQITGMEQTLREYVESCQSSPDCPLPGTPDDGLQQISALLAKLDATPGVAADGRAVTSSTLLSAIFVTLSDHYNWLAPGYIFQGAVDGDFANVLEFADIMAGREDGSYYGNSTESSLATSCLDFATEQDPATLQARAAEFAAAAPVLGPYYAYEDLDCAGWPVEATASGEPVQATGAAPILVLSGTESPSAPLAWGQSLSEQLDSGVLVTASNAFQSAYRAGPCMRLLVDDYFMEGIVPAADPQCSEAKDEQAEAEGYDGKSRWPLKLE